MFEFLQLELFGPALLTGLCFALYLPILGCYLRLRDETYAALAYAQVGAVGALGAQALALPLGAGALTAAGVALTVKEIAAHWARRGASGGRSSGQGSVYALLLVLAWGLGVLLTSNLPLAERLGHALFDGQLLLTGSEQVELSFSLCAIGMLTLMFINRQLLSLHWFPANTGRAIWWGGLFDLLAVSSIAIATMRLGVMAVFALLLLPPWWAFRHARSWRSARWLAPGMGAVAYCLALGVSLAVDQPFGPVLVLALALPGLLPPRQAGVPTSS